MWTHFLPLLFPAFLIVCLSILVWISLFLSHTLFASLFVFLSLTLPLSVTISLCLFWFVFFISGSPIDLHSDLAYIDILSFHVYLPLFLIFSFYLCLSPPSPFLPFLFLFFFLHISSSSLSLISFSFAFLFSLYFFSFYRFSCLLAFLPFSYFISHSTVYQPS